MESMFREAVSKSQAVKTIACPWGVVRSQLGMDSLPCPLGPPDAPLQDRPQQSPQSHIPRASHTPLLSSQLPPHLSLPSGARWGLALI